VHIDETLVGQLLLVITIFSHASHASASHHPPSCSGINSPWLFTPTFYVSDYFLQLHKCYTFIFILLILPHTCPPCVKYKNQMHQFLDPEFDQPVDFNYIVSVLRDNMKNSDIRAKLISSHTHNTFEVIHYRL
jgi:hypothetical protein